MVRFRVTSKAQRMLASVTLLGVLAGALALALPPPPTDTTPPVTTAVVTPTPSAAGWNNSDVTVNLTALDDEFGTGVLRIYYKLDSGAWYNKSGASTDVPLINKVGAHTFSFYAVDNAGNPEAVQTIDIKVDKVAPGRTQCSIAGTKATLTSSDNAGGSGVASIMYSLDSGPTLTYAGPIEVGVAPHTLQYYAIDNAGNVETLRTTSMGDRRLATRLRSLNISGVAGSQVQLGAVLTVSGGERLEGKTVAFKVNGSSVGSGVTSDQGWAFCSYTIPSDVPVPDGFDGSGTNAPIGQYIVTATFTADSGYFGTTATSEITKEKTPVKISVTVLPTTTYWNSPIVIQAKIRRADNSKPIAGKTLSITLNGTTLGTKVSDSTGYVRLDYVIPFSISGAQTVTVAYAPTNDPLYKSGSGTANLTIEAKTSTSLKVIAGSGTVGEPVTISAYLLSRATPAARLAGKTIRFTVDGVTVGTAVTSITGCATVSVTPATSGSHKIVAYFEDAADANYGQTSGSGTLTVNP